MNKNTFEYCSYSFDKTYCVFKSILNVLENFKEIRRKE